MNHPEQAVSTVSFPSPLTPSVPGFSMACPAGWLVTDDVGIPMLVSYPDATDGFTPNVAVTVSRVAEGTTLANAVEAAHDGISWRAASAATRSSTDTTIAGCAAVERIYDITMAEVALPLVQRTAIFAVPSGSGRTTFVFQIQGTCLSHQEAWFEPTIAGVLQSFAFTES